MNNKAHLRPKDFDSNGDIIPMERRRRMKLLIDIDDNVFTRLFDNGIDTSAEDRRIIDRAVRNGTPYEERPQGKWITDYTAKQKRVVACNKCNCISIQGKSNFCPNCGADMRKGGAE